MPVNATKRNFGWKASNFKLLSINDKEYSLNDLKGENGTVIVFICNHCPYVKAIAERLSYEAEELYKLGISTIAIMSNDVDTYPEDSYDNMKVFAKKYNFNFPYLYDSTQLVARDYDAVCTPDFFGFNKLLEFQYRGRIDSGVMNTENATNIKRELFHAMIEIKEKGFCEKEQFNSFGCSIKWKIL